MPEPDGQPDPGERAALWLERSCLDYEGLQRLMKPLSDPPLAVYLLQQSVEKAVKALLVAYGQDEATVKRTFGHNSLRAYLVHFRRLTDALEPHFGTMQASTSIDFQNPVEDLRALEATRYRSEWAAAPLERVLWVCSFLAKLRRSIQEGVEGKLRQVLTDKGLHPTLVGLFSELHGPEVANEAQFKAISGSVQAELREQVKRWFDFVWALMALGFLAALTQPHHTAPRYPSLYGAPKDPIEAAKKNKLGSNLYHSPLGIAEGIEDVAKLTGAVLEALDPIPPAPSENDLSQVGVLLDRVAFMSATRSLGRDDPA